MHQRFKAIKTIIEAHLIDLPDIDPSYAVKVANNSVHLIPKNVFLGLYEEMPDSHGPITQVTPKTRRRPAKAKAVPATPLPPESKVRKPSPISQRCLQTLDQHGPLTSPELSGHLYPEVAQRFRVQNFSALSLDLRRKGWIEKRTEAATGLDKWFLTETGKEQLQ